MPFCKLSDLPDRRCRLRHPLRLKVTPLEYWVSDDRFSCHGIGPTPELAAEDYAYALLDLYEDLRRERDHLAPHLLDELRCLDALIVRVDDELVRAAAQGKESE